MNSQPTSVLAEIVRTHRRDAGRLPRLKAVSVASNSPASRSLLDAVLGRPREPYSEEARRRIEAALQLLPAEDRDTWFKIGAALHSTRWGSPAFEIWDEWSRKSSEKFDPAAQQQTWESFDRDYNGRKIGLGTLFELCKQHGDQAPVDTLPPLSREHLDDAGARPPVQRLIARPYSLPAAPSIPTRKWLYGHFLMRGCVSVTIAPGGAGKSTLSITDALAMATGRDLIGIKPAARLSVWVYNLEDHPQEVDRRIAACAIAHRISEAEIASRLFVNTGLETPLVLATQLRGEPWIDQDAFQALRQQILERKIDVLNLDPFVSLHEVPENDNGAIDRVVKALARLAHETDCAIHIVHHARKTNGADISVEDSRGASALINAARAARTMNFLDATEAAKLGITERFRYIKIYNGKLNFAPRTSEADWIEMRSVSLANGPPGGKADWVGVPIKWSPPKSSQLSPENIAAVRAALVGSQFRENVQAKDWIGVTICEALGWDHQNSSDKRRAVELIRKWTKDGWLTEIECLDDKRRSRKFLKIGAWPT